MMNIFIHGGGKMTILCKQLMNVIDDKRYIQDIICLWNDNCLETAECELEQSERLNVQKLVEQYIQSEFGTVFVVVDKNHDTIGFGTVSMKQDLVTNTKYGQIDELYVAPKYRKQKIGKEIVENIMEWFAVNHISDMYVHVDLDNHIAQSFWEHVGLEKEFFVLSSN